MLIISSLRLFTYSPKIAELIDPVVNHGKIDPQKLIAEIIDTELENPRFLIVLVSPLYTHEYFIFHQIENDDSSIFTNRFEFLVVFKN